MSNPDVRWRQRFQNYRKALTQLSAASQLSKTRPLTELEQQGLIQAFEFTHELAWNTMKDFLRAHGSTESIFGSKDATREAVSTGLIENGELWMEMIQSRNMTSHTYNEDTAKEIVRSIISGYVGEFELFEQTMLSREGSND